MVRNSACIELVEAQLEKRGRNVKLCALTALMLNRGRKSKESIKAENKLSTASALVISSIESLHLIKYLCWYKHKE